MNTKTRIVTLADQDNVQFSISTDAEEQRVYGWISLTAIGAEWTFYTDDEEYGSELEGVRARLNMFKESIDECLEQIAEYERDVSTQENLALDDEEKSWADMTPAEQAAINELEGES